MRPQHNGRGNHATQARGSQRSGFNEAQHNGRGNGRGSVDRLAGLRFNEARAQWPGK